MDIYNENSKHEYMPGPSCAFCFTRTHAQVINPGWLGLVLTALPLGDKGNPAIIFSEQEILISPLSGGEKAKIICKGLSSSAALPSLQPSSVLVFTGIKPSLTMVEEKKKKLLMERKEAEVRW